MITSLDENGRVGRRSVLNVGRALAGVDHRLNLVQGVRQPRSQLGAAAVLLDELKAVGSSPALVVDEGDATEKGTENDLRVVLEEVDLK